MRKQLTIGSGAILLCCLWASALIAQQTIQGEWTGGIDFGKEWQPTNFSFKTNAEGIAATLDFPEQNRIGLAANRVVFEPPHVRIEWRDGTALAVFDGVIKDDSISGEFVQGERRATFGLARYVKLSPQIYDQYAGSYQLTGDRFIDIGVNNADELRYADTKTGRIG